MRIPIDLMSAPSYDGADFYVDVVRKPRDKPWVK